MSDIHKQLHSSLIELEQINLEFLKLLKEKNRQAYIPLIDRRVALSDKITQMYEQQKNDLKELPSTIVEKARSVLSLDNQLLIYLDLEARKLQSRNVRQNWELSRQSLS